MKIKGTKNKLVVEGNLIFDRAEELKKSFLERVDKLTPSKPVILDLSGVEEVDSSGLQLLMSFFKSLQNRGITYNITGVKPAVLELLHLSGLAKYFRFDS